MLDIPSLVRKAENAPAEALNAHPRLYIDAEAVSRLCSAAETPMLRASQAVLESCASEYAASSEVPYDPTGHNALCTRAGIMQARILAMLLRWLQTKDESLRRGVLASIAAIRDWPQWSWIDWFQDRTPDDEAEFVTFDLSYGTNSLTLAIAWDLLYDTLTEDEKAIFIGCIQKHRVFETFLRCVEDPDFKDRKGNAGWFIQNEKCNWLAVLCGGMGTLSLAVYEEFPEAKKALIYCDEAMMTLMRFTDECRGSWPEGLGYLCFTLQYAVPYLVSWEAATGKAHPAFALPGTAKINEYFLDLMPGGMPCTFGDSNSPWQPQGFHYMLARRLSQTDLFPLLDAQYHGRETEDPISLALGRLLFAPRGALKASDSVQTQVIRFYPGSNVTVMADRLPGPGIEMVIRGGNTRGAHEHNDLSSFHLVVGGEPMITSLSTDDYMDSTFSVRRMEIYEMTPQAKNVLLINGLGMQMYSEVTQEPVELNGFSGIRMDCTGAMGKVYQGQPAVESYFRTYLMLSDRAFLIADQAVLGHAGRIETRLHTYADVTLLENGAKLYACGTAPAACRHAAAPEHPVPQTLYIAFAADRDCTLLTGTDLPTFPKKPSSVIRYVTKNFEHSLTAVALLSRDPGSVAVEDGAVCVTLDGQTLHIPL